MNNSKVWVVLGAMDGLGNAAIKYLIANNQIVIAFIKEGLPKNTSMDISTKNLYMVFVESFATISLADALRAVISTHGSIDFIINNSNYKLFNNAVSKTAVELQSDISADISVTTRLIESFIPYLHQEPKGSLINLPPQLCLAVVPDKADAERLAFAMELFLNTLQTALEVFECRLSFLKPGDRFADFIV